MTTLAEVMSRVRQIVEAEEVRQEFMTGHFPDVFGDVEEDYWKNHAARGPVELHRDADGVFRVPGHGAIVVKGEDRGR